MKLGIRKQYLEILNRDYPGLSPDEAGLQRSRDIDAEYARYEAMIIRRARWIILAAVAVVVGSVLFCILAGPANAQPPQPGDTPPPMPDVFEVGLLSASITCPPSVAACSVLVLDVSGTSPGERTLRFAPTVPQAAIRYDSGGELIYVWVRKPGSYGVLWSVTNDDGEAGAGASFMVLARGDEPPPDPDDPDNPDDDPSPEDAAFMDYVRGLIDEEAPDRDTVAATFRGIAGRIDAGELRGSQAIKQATLKGLFGKDGKQNPAWWEMNTAVWDHLLNAKALDSDAEWSRHYRLIARAVEDE